jgi:uncharacterized Fe-S cluster-containing radical SAM superfamily protein
LGANEVNSVWLTSEQLVELYLAEDDCPLVIDCSGGQPDLIPEWVPWMMEALTTHDLAEKVYLWSDDNLSNDYFWRYLSPDQRQTMKSYQMYGRVCCFKGFNAESFAFNTKAAPELYERQFELFTKLLTVGIDLYAYATFTSPTTVGVADDVRRFMDRLQAIHPNLPRRLVPLRIEEFGVVQPRVHDIHRKAMNIQENAVTAWNNEMVQRFSEEELQTPMPAVSLDR